jgi:short-subunit dehydrogenase
MTQKTVIITGASSGIGKAMVYEFAKRNAQIVIAARNFEKLQIIEKELSEKGIQILAVKTDVSVEEDCKNLINKTIEKFGKIDILVNNAGISMRALFNDLDLSVLKKLMDVNFWGTVYCTKHAMKHLLETKGITVAVTSTTGYAGLPARTGYASSKFAVHGFMESLRMEHFKTGLHVMVVAPGYTESDVRINALTADGTPQGITPRKEEKLMSAEQAAQKITKAIFNRKRALTLTFGGKFVIFMRKIFPRLLDKITVNTLRKVEHDTQF